MKRGRMNDLHYRRERLFSQCRAGYKEGRSGVGLDRIWGRGEEGRWVLVIFF